MRALFAGQQPDGGFGGHPYRKWGGAHWRLVSLVELAIPAGEPRALAATEPVLAWLTSKARARDLRIVTLNALRVLLAGRSTRLTADTVRKKPRGAAAPRGIAEDPAAAAILRRGRI